MLRKMLISKVHRARVTQRDLNYIGSITIDKKILKATGMLPDEKVEVYNIDNGNRFSTYIIEGEPGSGMIGINGAAARLVNLRDKLIIVNFGDLDEAELIDHKAKIIVIENGENTEFRTL